jgi:hypothetical protein
MAIVGHHPENGVRLVVERSRAGEPDGPPWCYTGEAATQNASFRLTALLDANGAVTIELQPGAPAAVADKVRLIVRAAWKHADEEGIPPPRRIVRWRAER